MRTVLHRLAPLGLAALLGACVSDGGGGKDAGGGDGGAGSDAASGVDATSGTDAGYGPPIAGLGVSLDHLLDFLGGRRGVLVWVNSGGQVDMLDFRDDDPGVVTLVSGVDSINPLISPDGTRLVYSQGNPDGIKQIFVRSLDPAGAPQAIGLGDIGYWHVDGNSDEHIVFCDWSPKLDNGADKQTYRQKLVTGGTDLDGAAAVIHDRAMDAGPNAALTWLGQVYENLWAHDLAHGVDYPRSSFFLQDGTAVDEVQDPLTPQTCNGSMAPDDSARLMALAIPHEYIRVFSYDADADHFKESSRYNLPADMVEWEFPEWSSDPGFFTATLNSSDYRRRLFIVKHAPGVLAPERVEITGDQGQAKYSHLWLQP